MSNDGYWTGYFFGTDKFINPDRNSEVLLASLSQIYPDKSTETDLSKNSNWIPVAFYGASPVKKRANKMEITDGGFAINRKARYQSFELKTKPLTFPDDMEYLEKIWEVLDHNTVFFYAGDYNFGSNNFVLHPSGSCIVVASDDELEDDYEHGEKNLVITLQKAYPVRR